MAAPPPIAPGQDLLAVPNGDLADGLSGWGAVGPSLELVGGPLVQAADNTSVVTPPVTVPATGQSLPVRLGVPGANALLDVRARPLDGGPEVALGIIEPTRAVRVHDVPVGAVRGRTVQIVLDPITSLGRRLYVRSVGPVQEVLPGWQVRRGLPGIIRAWRRQGVRSRDGVLALRTPSLEIPAGVSRLGLVVRGSGVVRARAGARTVRRRAEWSRWTAIHVPIRPGRDGVVMDVTAAPRPGRRLVVAGVGTPVRLVRLSGASARPLGGRALVRARTRPPAPRAQAEVRIGRRVVGRGIVDASGRISVRANGSGPARLVLLPDAGSTGDEVPVRLPG